MLRKWAYWTGYIQCKDIPKKLEEMGNKGWELCSMGNPIKLPPNYYIDNSYCVFKRPGDLLNEIDKGRL